MPGICRYLEFAGYNGSQTCLPHEFCHTMLTAAETVRFQIAKDTRTPIGLLAPLEEFPEFGQQCLIRLLT